jgi:hypothetical protein
MIWGLTARIIKDFVEAVHLEDSTKFSSD